MIRATLLATLLAISLSLAGNAMGAQVDPGSKFGKPKSGRGFITVQGSVDDPRGLFLRVVSTRELVVSVTTVVDCSRRGGDSRVKDGAFNAIGPFLRRIGQPLKRADRCFVSAVATYEQGSKDLIKAQLFARHPKR
jgi:hypothetical protein